MGHSFYTYLLLAYTMAFSLLAFWRRRLWFLLASVSALLFCIWVYRGISNADGPGIVVALPIAGLLILGFFSGFLARAIIPTTRYFERRLPSWLVLIACFVTMPLAGYAWSTWQITSNRARQAPPSPSCQSRLHTAEIGKTQLALPLAPIISVGTGFEFEPAFLFDINEQARRFCDEAAKAPPQLTNVTVRIEPDYTRYLAVRSSQFCQSEKPYGWWHDSCRRETGDGPTEYPLSVTIYAIDRYNASKMHAFSADELAKFPLHSQKGWKIAEGVTRYGEERPYFTRSDIPGYLARCYETGAKELRNLYCVAGYRLTPDLGLIYEFRTPMDDFAKRSMLIDKSARAVFLSLQVRE